jgi:hypothetical protein
MNVLRALYLHGGDFRLRFCQRRFLSRAVLAMSSIAGSAGYCVARASSVAMNRNRA